jgi:hypothetical protein
MVVCIIINTNVQRYSGIIYHKIPLGAITGVEFKDRVKGGFVRPVFELHYFDTCRATVLHVEIKKIGDRTLIRTTANSDYRVEVHDRLLIKMDFLGAYDLRWKK